MRWALSIPGELILRAGVWLDPGITPCVKTHTITKCRKYNSPTRYRTSCAQHDSTPWCAISSRCFYVRGGRRSFRTAKTLEEHNPLEFLIGSNLFLFKLCDFQRQPVTRYLCCFLKSARKPFP